MSGKGRARVRRYQATKKGKVAMARYSRSDQRRFRELSQRTTKRLDALKY